MLRRLLQLISGLAILSVLLGALAARPAHAATTWIVESASDGTATPANCPGSGCRLRDALAAAGSGDTIQFAVTGTITLTQGIILISATSVTIQGPGSAVLTISGNNQDRIFGILQSTVSISGLTLTNGLVNNANEVAGNIAGGAIGLVNNSQLSLNDVAINNSSALCSPCTFPPDGDGGAIFATQTSSLAISNSSFANNSATLAGGAIEFESGASTGADLSLTNVSFSGNQVLDTTSGAGGAVRVSTAHSATLNAVTFSNNTAGFSGGALEADANPITITNSTFTSNQADGAAAGAGGGAIHVASPGFVTLKGSTLSGNSAASWLGGAVNVRGAAFEAVNSTFQGNSTGYNLVGPAGGGGIFVSNGVSTSSVVGLLNVTMSGNGAATGSGGALFNDGSNVELINTILANSTSGASDCASTNSFSINDSNLIETNDSVNPCNTPAVTGNPMLGALSNNGGPTQTMPLGPGSPAIDAGDDTWCNDPSTVNRLDQRGRPRNADGDHDGSDTSLCDIGAFELPTFADLPVTGKEWMEAWIDAFYNHGITTGCGVGPLVYCPENDVTREEMAVFLLRAIHGSSYTPPNVTGIFADMPVAGKEWMEPWVDEFYNEGITTGCGVSPLSFCPTNNVTRAEMAVFILRAVHGSSYTPPNVTGIFADMPVTGKEWMEPWVDEFYNEGITTGCGVSPLRYCPENNVTRAEMAVFIDRAFHLYP